MGVSTTMETLLWTPSLVRDSTLPRQRVTRIDLAVSSIKNQLLTTKKERLYCPRPMSAAAPGFDDQFDEPQPDPDPISATGRRSKPLSTTTCNRVGAFDMRGDDCV